MKLQFPLTIGVFVASFGAVGCESSNAEIPDRGWWRNDASVDDAASADANTATNDGAIYGNEAGADAGGRAHQAGSGGEAGSGDEAGSGGSAGEEEPVAGSGGSAGEEEPVAGSGGSGNTCPSEYSMAMHVVVNVEWPSSSAVAKGSGQVHLWSKSNFVEDGDSASVVGRSCGSTLPAITPSALATAITGTQKILPEIPNAAWDTLNMPSFPGTSTRTGNTIVMNPGVALVGLTMSNPTGTWPAVGNIMGVDHDGDSKLGLTAIPKETSGYSAIPVELKSSPLRADKVYLATRTVMTLSATVEGCPETYTGTANVTKLDNHVIGCHVKGGGECNTTQRNFVDDNTTVFTIKSATFTTERISETATCADVRAALP
jgi:hypothetical protein